ncbi:hypothetical protein SAMN03159341_10314 [Paenibacillus sp. 1_12]|uniref:hypothetical protein n=1 Tax=Paenibacillus sp. 1_12 TaxID=1566278 RepID=UPI0008EBD31D|nr:hypothetical protein [Paenibacillus sp. 1_12]SFL06134.1 hypothetical protein SAMN03159341_10314 [Paenibacillus sp. 1_12]
MRYSNILETIRKNPSKHNFEGLSEAGLKREIVEGIPEDYIDFLKEVGYGTVNDTYFSFYGGLVEVEKTMAISMKRIHILN